MRSKRFYFLTVFVIPLLFFIQNPRITEPVHSISQTLLKPVYVIGQSSTQFFSGIQTSWGHFWGAFHEQDTMKQKVQELQAEVHLLQEVAKENQRLKRLLSFREQAEQKMTMARVIGREASIWRRTLLLDKGGLDGLEKDMPVVVAEGLVGRIIEVGPITSRVLVITDPDSRVSALAGDSRAQGVLAGKGSTSFKFSYLELDSGVAVGEMVLSSGMGGLYPKGFPIGKIGSLKKDITGLHLVADVQPLVRFSKLEEVLCIVSPRQK